MNLLNTIRKASIIWFYIVLFVVGLAFAGIAGFVIFTPKGETATTTATVSNVECNVDSFGDVVYTCTITYDVDGTEYVVDGFGCSSDLYNGDTMEVEYEIADPTNVSSTGGSFILYIFALVGVGCMVAAVVLIVKSSQKSVESMNEYDQVNTADVTPEVAERIAEISSQKCDYYFHFTGKLNQSYVMEDLQRNAKYEAIIQKITLFKPYQFEFVNHVSGERKMMEISHTISTNIGGGSGFSYRVPIDSSFKIDGINNWKYLADNGYGFDFYMQGITPCYKVKHLGVEIATIETAGTNILKDGANSLIGKAPVNGLFKVSCNEAEIEFVFMTCFSIARAIFFEN